MKRDEYTRLMWENLPDAIKDTQSLTTTQERWWQDTRATGGLRLSWLGFADLVDHLDLEHWTFNFERQGIPPWIYLKLDHYLTAPYYIVDNKKITCLTVFSSRDSMMINLYGNVEKWIASLA